MDHVEKSIEVNVPVRTAYNQWTQFEDFPKFMENVKEVKQLDDKHLHWRAQVGSKEVEWDADITDQVPDKRVAWHSTSGAENAGTVTFQAEGPDKTRVNVRLDYDPKGVVENVGDAAGVMGRQVEGDLKRYKDFIESRGTATGAWRGDIHGKNVQPPPNQKQGGTNKNTM